MKKAIPLIICQVVFALVSVAQSLNWQWARGSNGNAQCEGWSAATDANGNVYVIGEFSGAVTIGDTILINAGNKNGLYIAKYDAVGNSVWVKAIDTISASIIATAIDGNNNIYITGAFVDTIKLGPYTLVNPNSNIRAMYVAKYDDTGNIVWAKCWGGVSLSGGQGLAADNNNNLFVTGIFSGNVPFGLDSMAAGFYGAGFIVKYNAAGNVIWGRALGMNSAGQGYSTATDANGNVFVAGFYYADSITFGNTTFYNHIGPMTAVDLFLVKYDSAGNLQWAMATGGDGSDQANWVATDNEGNAYITGFFRSDSITFGNTTLYNACPIATCGGSADAFMCKYSPTGALLWANRYGGIADDAGYSLATDVSGNLYASGKFNSDSIVFDSTTLHKPLIGVDPAFLVVCDTGGHVHYAEAFSSGGDDQNVVCINKQGNGFFVGDFVLSPFGIGPDTLLGPPDTTAFFDFENMFVARFKYGKGGPIGIKDLNTAPVLKLYPNPFGNTAMVEYSLPSGAENASLIIYDMLGRVRCRYPLSNTTAQVSIDASMLSSGIYLYTLVANGNVLLTQKMVVE